MDEDQINDVIAQLLPVIVKNAHGQNLGKILTDLNLYSNPQDIRNEHTIIKNRLLSQELVVELPNGVKLRASDKAVRIENSGGWYSHLEKEKAEEQERFMRQNAEYEKTVVQTRWAKLQIRSFYPLLLGTVLGAFSTGMVVYDRFAKGENERNFEEQNPINGKEMLQESPTIKNDSLVNNLPAT